MTEELREKVLAVEKFKVAEGITSVEACKRMKFPITSFYTYRRRALGISKAYQAGKAAGKKRKPYTKRSVPQLMNVTIPTESSTISVVVLKGNTEAIREIVTGLGGVFRG